MVVYSVLFFKMIVLTNQTLYNAILNPLFLQNNSLSTSNIDGNYTLITLTQFFQSIQFQHISTYFHDKTKTQPVHPVRLTAGT